jgi:cysteine-rich repeat protein
MRALLLPLAFFACDGGSSTPDTGVPDTGVSQPVVVSTTALDLGAIVLMSSARATFTITNPDGQGRTVALSAATGPDAARFSRSVNIPEDAESFPLEARGIATVTVMATAESEGPIAAEISVDDQTVSLTAKGVLSAIECPADVDLGLANPGGCISRKLTCTNAGNAVEHITAVELEPASDPSFMLAEPALPIDLGAGSDLPLDVTYCPTEIGTHEGDITVATFTPFQTEHTIHLVARSGGADLACEPTAIDFGAVGVGAQVTASVVCTNRGVEAASLTATVDSSEFSIPNPSLAIDPGASGSIEVQHAPTSEGDKRATLLIASNDPDSPELAIVISSRALMVDPCTAVIEPGAIDLGLVGIGDARLARFYVHNTGAATCLVRNVHLGQGSSSDVRIASAPAPGATIDPGTSTAFDVELAPQSGGTIAATLVVAFTNPGTGELTATLDAISGVTPVTIDPPVVDFGPTPLGCAAPQERSVRLRRVSTGSGNILNVSIQNDPAGAFGVIATPRQLAFYEELELTVTYDPPAAGTHTAELHIFTDAAPTPLIVPVSGETAATAMHVETTVLAPRAVDLLLLVDDSCSMGAAQEALSDALDVLDTVRRDRRANVRAAVITTDMEDPLRSGRFQGTPPVLDGSSPSFLADLRSRVMPGTNGSGDEMGVLALQTALTPPLIDMDNAGFLRPEADLAVVIVSDENDSSPIASAVPNVVAAMRAAAGADLRVAGIVGPANNTCSGPYGQGNAAPRWAELIGRAQGDLQTSFCSLMQDNLQTIGESIFGASSLPLRSLPVIGTIAVRVDGAALPGSAWTYDLSANRVVLDTAGAPIGATVEISYRSICLSPTCGDGNTDATEQCDDMNPDDDDACIACNNAVCGDGIVQTGVEPCDDGNLFDGDACLPLCIAARCGDGIIQIGVEACDDGNASDGDGCPATCRFYQLAGPTSEAFVPLTVGSTLTPVGGGGDPYDDGAATIVLPFEFRLFDIPSSTLSVSVNGFVAPGNAAVADSWINEGFPGPGLPDGIVAVWWDDLYLDEAIAGASISWAVLGVAPVRVAVIEWSDLRLQDHDAQNHRRFTFQLRIEESGAIRFAFGDTDTLGTVPSAASASSGIEDPTARLGIEALGCSPDCDGRPRPPRADGFPVQSVVTFTP